MNKIYLEYDRRMTPNARYTIVKTVNVAHLIVGTMHSQETVDEWIRNPFDPEVIITEK